MTSTSLSCWTVYKSPRDYPGKFVARRWINDHRGSRPTANIIISSRLETIQDKMARHGLHRLPRFECDDPVILEVWL